ncbi:EAL domain-containing protein [Colwellia sp. 6_MG-2023]|uniref:sensor domain-containing protein n=1 Tax=Colwellia sp. 6_MG-2023 TaxID=3062676 RepID=UPI0026E358F0|nr:EAL domain-containing protein [Colwellia sp. 6_MG-2023]MDO6488004.1 EAL domain-containing protein [Colwellia sp. 6_MG-2023]
MTSILNNVLNAMQQVIIEPVEGSLNLFKLVGGSCLWATELLPLSASQKVFSIDDNTPFLQDFLIDAQLIWNGSEDNRVRSGFWTEVVANNKELHLEAIAIKQDDQSLLIISNQTEDFTLRQSTMQSARELSLYNDHLIEQNEYLHTRILAIFNKPYEQENIITALTKAIENAGFAVLITKSDLTTIIANTAALHLFEQGGSSNHESSNPVDIIVQLLKNQLPEYERIIATKSSWDGELCWMSPPSTLKWLKVALYPVLDDLNEIKNWIIFANDISNIKYLVQRNEKSDLQDLLTQLPNRISFWQRLEKQIISNIPFYLLYVDVNDFRRHNEFYGHDEGDKLLIEVSGRIKSSIKTSDFIARVGGDEFAIILTDIDNQACCEGVVERILDCTREPFQTSELESFNVNLSIGAANFPHDAHSVEELMKFVDLSAYNGKRSKANSLQFYSQSMKDASRLIIEVEHELREAIKNDEFELFLQPIIDLELNKIVKAEALIRWNHPTKGMLFPDSFIAIAEKSGLIITIGKWVIDTACQMVDKINKMGHKVKISLNLSPAQVFDEKLFPHLHACIKNNKIDPCLLELEITEGVMIDDYAITEKLLNKVRAIGVSVSIDDFGTGYSSLAYLKKLPLDFLKIDRSFVRDIVSDDNDKAIVRAVIAMAHNLNLGVIAEGVETQEQLDFLEQNSCNSVQGYFFSKPIEFSSFIMLLQNQKKKDFESHSS